MVELVNLDDLAKLIMEKPQTAAKLVERNLLAAKFRYDDEKMFWDGLRKALVNSDENDVFSKIRNMTKKDVKIMRKEIKTIKTLIMPDTEVDFSHYLKRLDALLAKIEKLAPERIETQESILFTDGDVDLSEGVQK